MRLKVKVEGYIDLDEEQTMAYKDFKNTKESKINYTIQAIGQDIEENIKYINIKNISVEEESKI